jgi:hypothetical protein
MQINISKNINHEPSTSKINNFDFQKEEQELSTFKNKNLQL